MGSIDIADERAISWTIISQKVRDTRLLIGGSNPSRRFHIALQPGRDLISFRARDGFRSTRRSTGSLSGRREYAVTLDLSGWFKPTAPLAISVCSGLVCNPAIVFSLRKACGLDIS
jgi:hypothetical protein